jgi:hypothetical protein
MKKQLLRFGMMAGLGAFFIAQTNAKNVMASNARFADTSNMTVDTAMVLDTANVADTANFTRDTALLNDTALISFKADTVAFKADTAAFLRDTLSFKADTATLRKDTAMRADTASFAHMLDTATAVNTDTSAMVSDTTGKKNKMPADTTKKHWKKKQQ